jgi:pentatricopeptide repeat protein
VLFANSRIPFDALLDEIEHETNMQRSQATYGSLMTAREQVGDVKYVTVTRPFQLLKQEENLTGNAVIYAVAISCCRKAKDPDRAMGLLQKMISKRQTANVACFNTVLIPKTDAKLPKDKDTILQIYQRMKMNQHPEVVVVLISKKRD